jgi:hypothetical protein
MTKRASVHSDAEKRRLVRAVIRDPCAARFRAGEKKAEGQVELSRSRRVRAQDLLESDEVAFRCGRNLSGTAGYDRPVSKITQSLGRAFVFTPGRR